MASSSNSPRDAYTPASKSKAATKTVPLVEIILGSLGILGFFALVLGSEGSFDFTLICLPIFFVCLIYLGADSLSKMSSARREASQGTKAENDPASHDEKWLYDALTSSDDVFVTLADLVRSSQDHPALGALVELLRRGGFTDWRTSAPGTHAIKLTRSKNWCLYTKDNAGSGTNASRETMCVAEAALNCWELMRQSGVPTNTLSQEALLAAFERVQDTVPNTSSQVSQQARSDLLVKESEGHEWNCFVRIADFVTSSPTPARTTVAAQVNTQLGIACINVKATTPHILVILEPDDKDARVRAARGYALRHSLLIARGALASSQSIQRAVINVCDPETDDALMSISVTEPDLERLLGMVRGMRLEDPLPNDPLIRFDVSGDAWLSPISPFWEIDNPTLDPPERYRFVEDDLRPAPERVARICGARRFCDLGVTEMRRVEWKRLETRLDESNDDLVSLLAELSARSSDIMVRDSCERVSDLVAIGKLDPTNLRDTESCFCAGSELDVAVENLKDALDDAKGLSLNALSQVTEPLVSELNRYRENGTFADTAQTVHRCFGTQQERIWYNLTIADKRNISIVPESYYAANLYLSELFADHHAANAALAYADEACRVAPTSARAAYDKYSALLQLDRVDEAEDVLKNAIQRTSSPTSLSTLFSRLAMVEKKKGRADVAAACYKRAAKIDPTSKDRREKDFAQLAEETPSLTSLDDPTRVVKVLAAHGISPGRDEREGHYLIQQAAACADAGLFQVARRFSYSAEFIWSTDVTAAVTLSLTEYENDSSAAGDTQTGAPATNRSLAETHRQTEELIHRSDNVAATIVDLVAHADDHPEFGCIIELARRGGIDQWDEDAPHLVARHLAYNDSWYLVRADGMPLSPDDRSHAIEMVLNCWELLALGGSPENSLDVSALEGIFNRLQNARQLRSDFRENVRSFLLGAGEKDGEYRCRCNFADSVESLITPVRADVRFQANVTNGLLCASVLAPSPANFSVLEPNDREARAQATRSYAFRIALLIAGRAFESSEAIKRVVVNCRDERSDETRLSLDVDSEALRRLLEAADKTTFRDPLPRDPALRYQSDPVEWLASIEGWVELGDEHVAPTERFRDPANDDSPADAEMARICGVKKISDFAITDSRVIAWERIETMAGVTLSDTNEAAQEGEPATGMHTPSTSDIVSALMTERQTTDDPFVIESCDRTSRALVEGTIDAADLESIKHDFFNGSEFDHLISRGNSLFSSNQIDQDEAENLMLDAEAQLKSIRSTKMFADTNEAVWRYFDSYPERVAYNRANLSDTRRVRIVPHTYYAANLMLARLHHGFGHESDALVYSDELLRLSPFTDTAIFARSQMLIDFSRNYEAEEELKRSITNAITPTAMAHLFYLLGIVEWKLGNGRASIACYERTRQLDPSSALAVESAIETQLMSNSSLGMIPNEQVAQVLEKASIPVGDEDALLAQARDEAAVCADHGLFNLARAFLNPTLGLRANDALSDVMFSLMSQEQAENLLEEIRRTDE